MADETVEQRGRRVAAESAARKLASVLDGFVITAGIGTVDGGVVVILDPLDVGRLADEIADLRYEARRPRRRS